MCDLLLVLSNLNTDLVVKKIIIEISHIFLTTKKKTESIHLPIKFGKYVSNYFALIYIFFCSYSRTIKKIRLNHQKKIKVVMKVSLDMPLPKSPICLTVYEVDHFC